jgi:hypothetical protein
MTWRLATLRPALCRHGSAAKACCRAGPTAGAPGCAVPAVSSAHGLHNSIAHCRCVCVGPTVMCSNVWCKHSERDSGCEFNAGTTYLAAAPGGSGLRGCRRRLRSWPRAALRHCTAGRAPKVGRHPAQHTCAPARLHRPGYHPPSWSKAAAPLAVSGMYEAHALAAGLTCVLRGGPWLMLDPLPRSALHAEWLFLKCPRATACTTGTRRCGRQQGYLNAHARHQQLPAIDKQFGAVIQLCGYFKTKRALPGDPRRSAGRVGIWATASLVARRCTPRWHGSSSPCPCCCSSASG